jgi:hypothetical protein
MPRLRGFKSGIAGDADWFLCLSDALQDKSSASDYDAYYTEKFPSFNVSQDSYNTSSHGPSTAHSQIYNRVSNFHSYYTEGW